MVLLSKKGQLVTSNTNKCKIYLPIEEDSLKNYSNQKNLRQLWSLSDITICKTALSKNRLKYHINFYISFSKIFRLTSVVCNKTKSFSEDQRLTFLFSVLCFLSSLLWQIAKLCKPLQKAHLFWMVKDDPFI